MKNEIIKAHCNKCNQITNHKIIEEYKKQDLIEIEVEPGKKEQHLSGIFRNQIIECMGCTIVSYRTLDEFNNFMEPNNNGTFNFIQNKVFEKLYPERAKCFLYPRKIINVPVMINKAYQEVIESYNNELRILCTGGLRVLIEGICNHFSIKNGSLAERINSLSKKGILSQKTSESLHFHRLVGNSALHSLEMPEKEELKTAIEILEHTLYELFELPVISSRLIKIKKQKET